MEACGLGIEYHKGIPGNFGGKRFPEKQLVLLPKSGGFLPSFFREGPLHRIRACSWNLISIRDWISLMVLKLLFNLIFSSLPNWSRAMNLPESLLSRPCLVRNFNSALLA